jgi:D-serine deaminase-like pyridoxal phosphate-dependent protein
VRRHRSGAPARGRIAVRGGQRRLDADGRMGSSYEGITEVRCGVYMFCDVFQSEIASCSREDIAVSVLATVIGHRPDINSALIDAGALALSKDRSTGAPGLREDIGFGLVMDMTGAPHRPGQSRARLPGARHARWRT